jgi:hypothetical protein
MTTIAIADKNRLTLRGTENGRSYLITSYPDGWWVQEAPAPRPPARRREWAGPAKDLGEHLDQMAASGLELQPIKGAVPPCRF